MKSLAKPASVAPMETLFPELSTEAVLSRARAHYTPNYRQQPLVLIRGEGPLGLGPRR